MDDQEVPRSLKDKIIDYFDYLWKRNEGENIKLLLRDAPSTLLAELYVSLTKNMINQVGKNILVAYYTILTIILWPRKFGGIRNEAPFCERSFPDLWLYEPAKHTNDRADYCLDCSFLPSASTRFSGLGRV